MGVGRLMEFLGNVVPFVDDMPAVKNTAGEEVKLDAHGPTSIFFFKTAVERMKSEMAQKKKLTLPMLFF